MPFTVNIFLFSALVTLVERMWQIKVHFRNVWCGMEWVEGVTDSCRHSTPHHSGAEERRRLPVIPLLLKHIEEKQHAGSWHEEDKISMTAASSLRLRDLEACGAKLLQMFHFSPLSAFLYFFPPFFFFTFSHIPSPAPSWVVQTAAQPTLISQPLRLYWSTHSLVPPPPVSCSAISFSSLTAWLCVPRNNTHFPVWKPWKPSLILFLQL